MTANLSYRSWQYCSCRRRRLLRCLDSNLITSHIFLHSHLQLSVRLRPRVRRTGQHVRRDRDVLRPAAEPGAVLERAVPVRALFDAATNRQHAEPWF